MGSVLVTGATGFLGGHLVRRLKETGCSSIGLGRDPTRCMALQSEGHRMVRHDLAEPMGIQTRRQVQSVSAIVHCAALSAPFGPKAAFERANVSATRHCIELARELGVNRLILISTPAVYFAFQDQLNVPETAGLPSPVNHYARTKREAERLVLAAHDVGPMVLRPRGIYGRGDRALLPRLLQTARQRPLPHFRDGAARIDLTHVNDVTDAILAALAAGREADGGIFNVSGGEVVPVRDIADQACRRAGIDARWRTVPFRPALMACRAIEGIASVLPGSPEPPFTAYALGLFAFAQSLDITRARSVLDWQPSISFEDGLKRTFETGDAG
ncbi:MAG: NAD(P)-dependent oxidoreductase [Pseudomonadota bacterium]